VCSGCGLSQRSTAAAAGSVSTCLCPPAGPVGRKATAARLESRCWSSCRSRRAGRPRRRCGGRCVLFGGRLTEIQLCNVCSYQEILRRNGRGQAAATDAAVSGERLLAQQAGLLPHDPAASKIRSAKFAQMVSAEKEHLLKAGRQQWAVRRQLPMVASLPVWNVYWSSVPVAFSTVHSSHHALRRAARASYLARNSCGG
jgi:hypothetical protein